MKNEDYIKYGVDPPVPKEKRGSIIRDHHLLKYGLFDGPNQEEAKALEKIKYYLDAYNVDRKGRKMNKSDGGKHSSKVKRRSKPKKKSRKSPVKRKSKRKAKRKIKSKRKRSRRKSRY